MDHQINATNTWAVALPARDLAAVEPVPGRDQLDEVTGREGNRHRLDGRRHVELGDREHARQHASSSRTPRKTCSSATRATSTSATRRHWRRARTSRPTRTASARARTARMDPAYQLDETFAWFVPGKGGDHDLKFGANVVYTPLHIYDASTLNGAVRFLGRTTGLQRGQPAHLSGSADDSRARAVGLQGHRHLHGRVRPGQVEAQQPSDRRASACVGIAEIAADRGKGQPEVRERGRLSARHEQHRAAHRRHVGAGRREHVGRPRRLGHLLPEDAVHVLDRRRLVRRVLRLVHRELPGQQHRSGPVAGTTGRPTRSWSTARS